MLQTNYYINPWRRNPWSVTKSIVTLAKSEIPELKLVGLWENIKEVGHAYFLHFYFFLQHVFIGSD